MAPILRDDGPPVSQETIQEARRSLPLEYGYKIVGERGRKVILVRVPRAKPDYNYELADAALYIRLDELKDAKDVILIGDEKSVRMDPIRLRDHVREQKNTDQVMTEDFLRRLGRDYAYTVQASPTNHNHKAFAVRVPKRSVSELTPEDISKIHELVVPLLDSKIRECQLAYIVADMDFERVGRRVFIDLVAPDHAEAIAGAGQGKSANPLHHAYQTPGGLLASSAPAKDTPTTAYTPPPPTVPQVVQRAANAYSPPRGETIVADDKPRVNIPRVFTAPPPTAPATAAPVRMPTPTAHPVAPAPTHAPTASAPAAPAPTASAPAAQPAPVPEPMRHYEKSEENDEYEVMVSKPKSVVTTAAPAAFVPPTVAAPPQPVAPVQAPQPVAPTAPATEAPDNDGQAPSRLYHTEVENDEFEVIVTKPKSTVTIAPPVPMAQPPVAGQDSAPAVEPVVVPATSAIATLQERFAQAGYEVLTDVDVMGQTFDLAAHKIEGKRVLVKRFPNVDATLCQNLQKVATDLGADVAIAIGGDVAPGARLAAWGTRVLAVSTEEATHLKL